MDKKKIGILAILLFLIIGLGTFVFANPDNQEKFKDSEPEDREEIDSKTDDDKEKLNEEESSDNDTLLSSQTDSQNNQTRNAVSANDKTSNRTQNGLLWF